MDRAEQRRKEREEQKLKEQWSAKDRVNMAWYKSLPVSRKLFIGKFVEQEAIKNDNIVAMIMDKCILAAMDDNTDLSIILMKKIIKEYNDYILEYKEYLDKYGNGGMDMIENVKIREEVKGKMKVMIHGKVEKIKGMAKLKKEYNLPATELSELWIDCKVEMDQEKKLKKTGISDKEKKLKKTGISDQEKKYVKEENKALMNFEKDKLMCGPIPINSNLKVVNVVKEIHGIWNSYKKSNDGVELADGTKFSSKDEVGEKRVEVVSLLDDNILELEEKLDSMKKDREKRIDMFYELEQVFDL